MGGKSNRQQTPAGSCVEVAELPGDSIRDAQLPVPGWSGPSSTPPRRGDRRVPGPRFKDGEFDDL